jgi:MFS transporter, ACS family, tartrate transporter
MDAISSENVIAATGGVSPAAELVVEKTIRRLLPFLVACFFVAYLDRVNIGFAALTMNKELGFSPTVYGWGAGVFFFGYCLLEAPSNLILERVGARLWIARIMVSWGIVSAGMGLVWNETSFLALRFLLGAAEAGFSPGVILYLTYWLPAPYRARGFGMFLLALPLATAIGAPLSGFVLSAMDGVAGASAWRWLFFIEAAPAIFMGVAAYFFLTDKPQEASWLEPQERSLLQSLLDSEKTSAAAGENLSLRRMLLDPAAIRLGLIYFGIVAALYGLGFWLPQIVSGFGYDPLGAGLVTALPYICGGVAMALWSRSSDRRDERIFHTAFAAVLAAAGLAAAAACKAPAPAILALTAASVGTLAAMPPFWTLPPALLHRGAAAAGIAMVNSIGNLAGFFGPLLVGWIREATGEFSYALLALSAAPLISAAMLMRMVHKKER